jgi:hypothetical protein
MPISLPQEASLAAHPNPYRRTILACTRPALVGHAVELATAQPPPDDDGQVQTDASAGPAAPAPARDEAPTQADDEPGMDAAGDHADPGHPSHTAACPRRAPGPHFGRTQRTRQRTDTGRRHRTPDSGHLDAQTPAPDTGHRFRGQARWTLVARTGHRTLAEDVDRVTKARPASGPPGPPRRATVRWDAQPCSCGRRWRCSTAHAGRLGGEAAFSAR